MRSKWKVMPLLFAVLVLLSASGCSSEPSANTSIQSSQQEQTQSNSTSSSNESTRNVSIPPFKGTVTYGNLPLINIPKNEWEQAKQNFESEYPFLESTMKSVKNSDFALTDNWQGILDNEPFQLNVYSFQAQFLLVVSKYGNQPVKNKIFISGPRSAFAFYGDNLWLIQATKGVGTSLNIITNEFETSTSETENLNMEFDQLFTKLSAIEPEKRPEGTKLQIDGYNLLLVHDMVLVVIDN